MSRIQAWLTGRRSSLTRNGSLKTGGADGAPLPAQLDPVDPQGAPPTALDPTTTTGTSPVMRVVESRTESWPTPGPTWTDTTGIPTSPWKGVPCRCHESPSALGAVDES